VGVVTTPSLPLGPLGLVLVLALAELGCRPACEEAGLRGAAAAFEAHTFESRQQGFDALVQACPTMPPALARSLRAEFDGTSVEARRQLYADRIQDPAWNELLARTCPNVSPAGDDAEVLIAEDIVAGYPYAREACRLDRHELLADDDVFVERDFVVFMLHELLLAGRIEPALARDVVWPLLSASTPPEQFESMCLYEGLACERAIGSWGLQLPFSSIDLPTRGGTAIRISATELSVDQTPVLVLTYGRPAPGAFVEHVAPALQQALAARAAHGRMHSEREFGTPWPARIELVADLATPFGTIIDVVFTATTAGFDEAEIVVVGDGLHAIPLHRPGAEPEPDAHLRHERPLAFTLVVHHDSVEAGAEGMSPMKRFPSFPKCDPSTLRCIDSEAIAGFSKQLQSLFPHEREVTVRVDADVLLDAVVAIIDAARGDRCHLQPTLAGEPLELECQFFRPIVDAEPPLLFPARARAIEEEPQ